MSAKKKQKTDHQLANGSAVSYKMRESLFDEELISSIQKLWRSSEQGEIAKSFSVGKDTTEVQVIKYPFNVCVVHNLVPAELIQKITTDLPPKVINVEKNNDLYRLRQSEDVANLTDIPCAKSLYNIICKDLFSWVQKTFAPTGLRDQVAATFSLYSQGDRLLCHDDQCEDRHIAFVLYLTPDWESSDGGLLDLFDVNENGDPRNVVMSLTPKCNTLVLFEVNERSYHQVSEVVSSSKQRLSINGWFHKGDDAPQKPLELYTLATVPPVTAEFELDDYVFNKYFTHTNQIDIKTMFVANSELQLDQFFLKEFFKKVTEEFSSTDIEWKMVGPANIRHYEIPVELKDASTLSSLSTFLQSTTWLRYLKNITGLDFVPSPNSDVTAWQRGDQPTCKVEIQRWLPGMYTLIHDRDPEFCMDALDVFVRVPVCAEDAADEVGETPQAGHILYIDKDSKDDECLLHLGYKMNSLCLVFRENGTLRFTKYLDSAATPFYQVQCTYIPWAAPVDEPDLKHCETDDEPENDYEEVEDDDGNDDVMWEAHEEVEEQEFDSSSS